MVNSILGQVCRTTTTCDHEPISPLLSPNDVIRRGKSDPRGENWEMGLTGPKGSDQSEEVSKNSENFLRNGELIAGNSAVLSKHEDEIARINNKFAKMSRKFVLQNKTLTQQNEVIKNLIVVVEEQATKFIDQSRLIEEVLS